MKRSCILGWKAVALTVAGRAGPARAATPSEWPAGYLREHRKVPPDVWKLSGVGSASHCEACRARAANGSFRESEIRIPR